MTDPYARLEAVRYSRFHSRLLVMGGLGYAFDGFDVAVLGFVFPVLASQWKLSPVIVGLLGSSTFVGFFFGAIFAGLIADRMGRRLVMIGALVVYAAFSCASALCTTWQAFVAARILAGVGVGAESAIIAPFLVEFTSSRYRGLFTGAIASFFSFGFAGAALFCTFVVRPGPSTWRPILLCTAAPILLAFWWRKSLPESPRWLWAKGRREEAERIVSKMEAEARQPPLPSPGPPSPSPAPRTGPALPMLFSRGVAKLTVMSWILWLSITATYYAFFTWLPSLVLAERLGGSAPRAFTLAIYLAQIPGYFSAAYLNERIGRRAVIIAYMLGGAGAAVLFATLHSTLPLLLAGMLLSFCMNGTYAGAYAYTPELFPTAVRGTAMGLASAVGRLGAIGSPVLVGVVYPKYGLFGVFGVTTAVLCVGAAAVAFLGVPTKGRALESIA